MGSPKLHVSLPYEKMQCIGLCNDWVSDPWYEDAMLPSASSGMRNVPGTALGFVGLLRASITMKGRAQHKRRHGRLWGVVHRRSIPLSHQGEEWPARRRPIRGYTGPNGTSHSAPDLAPVVGDGDYTPCEA